MGMEPIITGVIKLMDKRTRRGYFGILKVRGKETFKDANRHRGGKTYHLFFVKSEPILDKHGKSLNIFVQIKQCKLCEGKGTDPLPISVFLSTTQRKPVGSVTGLHQNTPASTSFIAPGVTFTAELPPQIETHRLFCLCVTQSFCPKSSEPLREYYICFLS